MVLSTEESYNDLSIECEKDCLDIQNIYIQNNVLQWE